MFKKLIKIAIEIKIDINTMKRIKLSENNFKSFKDLMYRFITKNRDIKIKELIISLNSARNSLDEEKNEIIRIIIRKKDK